MGLFDLMMAPIDDEMDTAAAKRAVAERGPGRRLLTADDMAKRAGISEAYLAEIKRGSKNGGLRVVVRLADTLDVSLDDLVT